jgi:hypothetical protein
MSNLKTNLNLNLCNKNFYCKKKIDVDLIPDSIDFTPNEDVSVEIEGEFLSGGATAQEILNFWTPILTRFSTDMGDKLPRKNIFDFVKGIRPAILYKQAEPNITFYVQKEFKYGISLCDLLIQNPELQSKELTEKQLQLREKFLNQITFSNKYTVEQVCIVSRIVKSVRLDELEDFTDEQWHNLQTIFPPRPVNSPLAPLEAQGAVANAVNAVLEPFKQLPVIPEVKRVIEAVIDPATYGGSRSRSGSVVSSTSTSLRRAGVGPNRGSGIPRTKLEAIQGETGGGGKPKLAAVESFNEGEEHLVPTRLESEFVALQQRIQELEREVERSKLETQRAREDLETLGRTNRLAIESNLESIAILERGKSDHTLAVESLRAELMKSNVLTEVQASKIYEQARTIQELEEQILTQQQSFGETLANLTNGLGPFAVPESGAQPFRQEEQVLEEGPLEVPLEPEEEFKELPPEEFQELREEQREQEAIAREEAQEERTEVINRLEQTRPEVGFSPKIAEEVDTVRRLLPSALLITKERLNTRDLIKLKSALNNIYKYDQGVSLKALSREFAGEGNEYFLLHRSLLTPSELVNANLFTTSYAQRRAYLQKQGRDISDDGDYYLNHEYTQADIYDY